MKRAWLAWLFCNLLLTGACTPKDSRIIQIPGTTPTLITVVSPSSTAIQIKPFPSMAAPIQTPQARLTALPGGPDLENFLVGTNPLTGLGLRNPAMLDLPAVLVSISNMPPTARPQAGMSFAPWIYELFIGEGTTRFMGVFYGDMPRRIPNDQGDCPVNTNLFQPLGAWFGNRVWLDENQDGVQDSWEAGVGGACVKLQESASQKVIATTSTDSNGYYGLDASALKPGKNYTLIFKLPSAFHFSPAHAGNDDQDSDVIPGNGAINFTYKGSSDASLDAGLVLVKPAAPVYSPADIAPQRTYVGPIRSGRLTYNDFARMYPASCLVYASAGDGIRQQLKGCEIIFGEQPGVSPNTALLDTSRLLELAQKNKIPKQPVNYSGHLFDPYAPDGGVPGSSLWTYFHAYSQAFWQYDVLSGSYLRQTDDGDGLGVFHSDSDRLTGRQLAFENLVILMADYKVYRHGQYDIDLCCGMEGYAFLFRDGQMYRIHWSSNNRDWEQKTGLLRPLHFTIRLANRADQQPFALKPGRTWVSIMTINSALLDLKKGRWEALFAMPNDLVPAK